MAVKLAHQEATRKLVDDLMWEASDKGFTPEDLAELIGGANGCREGMSARTFTNYRYNDTLPSLPVFVGIIRTVKPVQTLRRLARQANGYFIQVGTSNQSDKEQIAGHTAAIMKETADVIAAAGAALRDGTVTRAEKKHITREIAELEIRSERLERLLNVSAPGGCPMPSLDDAIDAAAAGDVSVLDDFLRRGGVIPPADNGTAGAPVSSRPPDNGSAAFHRRG